MNGGTVPAGPASGAFRLLAAVLTAQAVVLCIGLGAGCGPDDLPPGILPGVPVMYEPVSRETTGTVDVTTSGISITRIEPTSPTAETTVTVTGQGFGTSAAAVGFRFDAAAVSATVVDASRPELTPVQFIAPVTLQSETQLQVLLPPDIVSGPVAVGIRSTTDSTSGASQLVSFSAVSAPFALDITPAILGQISGSLTPGNTFTLSATGLFPRLTDNVVRFRDSSGAELGTTVATALAFTPGLRSQIQADVPSSITTAIASVVLEVRGLRSASFP